MPTEEQLQDGFYIGDYEVLPKRRVIRKGDVEQTPEPQIFSVLMALARRNCDVVSRDELIDEVWGGRATADGPINRAVSQLRDHFGDKKRPYQYVEPKTGIGYNLVQPVRLKNQEPEATASAIKPRRLAGIALAVLVVLLVIIGRVIFDSAPGRIDSIGIQPFTVASDVTADAYIAVGLKEELVRGLVGASDALVKNGKVSYPDLTVRQIGRKLDVDVVISATLFRQGDMLEVKWRAERRKDGSTIVSDAVSGRKSEMLDFQRRLVTSVRSGMFPGIEQILITGPQPTGAGTDSYYLGLHAIERRGEPGYLTNAIDHFKAAIRLDPNLGPAYLALATAYALLADFANAPVEQANRLAIETIKKGIEVDDTIEEAAGAIYGFVYHKEKRWEEAEAAYQRAINARLVDANAFNWYSRMLASVGRLDASRDVILRAQMIDPDNPIINSRVAIAYAWLDDADNAAEFFERSRQLEARGPTHLLANALFLTRSGQYEAARVLARTGVSMQGINVEWIDPVFEALSDPLKRGEALAAFNTALDAQPLTPQIEVVVRTLLGDLDNAMRVARLLEQPGEAFEMDLLFIPEMRPLHEHPGFMPLLDALGITRYWDARGCELVDGIVRCTAI